MTVLDKYAKAVTPHPTKSFIKDTLMQVSNKVAGLLSHLG